MADEEVVVQAGGGAAHEPEVVVEESVLVAPGDDAGATARALLAAVDASEDYTVRDVEWSDGNFVVPVGLAAAADVPEDEDDEDDADEDDSYDKWTVAQLKTEIDARNEGRNDDVTLSADGKKADLIATLEADDDAS